MNQKWKIEKRIKFNKKLLWDYDISEEDLEKEDVYLFYISRVLNNGTFDEVKEIPIEFIEKTLVDLIFRQRSENSGNCI